VAKVSPPSSISSVEQADSVAFRAVLPRMARRAAAIDREGDVVSASRGRA
jgi:hypothetical protein